MKLARAQCPSCGQTMAVRPPRGGDGSMDVYPWHWPGGALQGLMRCTGSRAEVRREDYREQARP